MGRTALQLWKMSLAGMFRDAGFIRDPRSAHQRRHSRMSICLRWTGPLLVSRLRQWRRFVQKELSRIRQALGSLRWRRAGRVDHEKRQNWTSIPGATGATKSSFNPASHG